MAIALTLQLVMSPVFAATSKPTTKATSKSSTKSTVKSTAKKSSTKKVIVGGVNIANFGYVGHKDASDIDVPPTITQLSGTVLDDTGAVFKLPDVASAKNVLNLIISDLAEANIKCEVIDPTVSPLITLAGSVSSDTIAACKGGDPAGTGFIEYVITDKSFVAQYNQAKFQEMYLNFQTPITGKGEQTQFTPSSRAILLVVGGEYAFDASEISWAVLYNLRYAPPVRTNSSK